MPALLYGYNSDSEDKSDDECNVTPRKGAARAHNKARKSRQIQHQLTLDANYNSGSDDESEGKMTALLCGYDSDSEDESDDERNVALHKGAMRARIKASELIRMQCQSILDGNHDSGSDGDSEDQMSACLDRFVHECESKDKNEDESINESVGKSKNDQGKDAIKVIHALLKENCVSKKKIKSLERQVQELRSMIKDLTTEDSDTTSISVDMSSILTADILTPGLLLAGFEPAALKRNSKERKNEWFKAFYGVPPSTVAPYLAALHDDNPGIDFKDCLMTLNWLFLYSSYPVLRGRWKRPEEYIAGKVVEIGTMMQKLAEKHIKFDLENNVELGRTIDCVNFLMQEFRLDPSTRWFDPKSHSCGVVS